MSRARVVFVLSMEKYHYLLLQIVLEITAVLVNNNNKGKKHAEGKWRKDSDEDCKA